MLPQLPIAEIMPSLAACLAEQDQAIVLAPPGAGKTSLIPLQLLAADWLAGQKIILLQPRRLAVKSVALRLAELLGEPVGEQVGYRVRLEVRVGPTTRLEVMTEGLFVRLLQSDPSLEGVGAVIFDECHERHLDTDLSLALLLNGRAVFADLREHPLKLLMMSATLDGSGLQDMLASACGQPVSVLASAGRSYPVTSHYLPAQRTASVAETLANLSDLLLPLIGQALAHSAGSILVFLPGLGEIKRLQAGLVEYLTGLADVQQIKVLPLHGGLSLKEQRRVVAPPPAGKRHIILATSVAQTSLTIEGVDAVVDSGLIRLPRYDPKSGLTRLVTERVARATATQRAGRAGRLGPGIAYHAWTESQHFQLLEREAPEIQSADLSALYLQALQWGVTDTDQLYWLDAPPPSAVAAARKLLLDLAAVAETDGVPQITDMGRRLIRIPASPRLARMLMAAFDADSLNLAAKLAALAEARDSLVNNSSADIQLRLSAIADSDLLRREAQQIERVARPLVNQSTTGAVPSADLVGYLLAHAYPDRVAKRGRGTAYTLANGRGVALEAQDPLLQHEWLVVANSGGHSGRSRDRVFLAAPLNPELLSGPLAQLCSERDEVAWTDSGRFVARRQRSVGRLTLWSQELPEITIEQRNRGLLAYIREQGMSVFAISAELAQWRARLALMAQLYPEETWPDVADESLLASLEQWLLPAIDQVHRLADLRRLPLLELLQGLLVWPQPKQLDKRLPASITVPSGLLVAIDYSQSPPVLAVKLQAMFGLSQSPRLAEGRQPLAIHLLSPAQRPLQITQDLASFWAGSYHQVRKELKGRYPKHPWPEDPANAQATHRAKPRAKPRG